MTIFRSMNKILLKRYRIWIILMIFLYLLIEVSSFTYFKENQIFESIYYGVRSLDSIEKSPDGKTWVVADYNDDFYGYYDMEMERFKEKYKDGFPENYFAEKIAKYNQIKADLKITDEDIFETFRDYKVDYEEEPIKFALIDFYNFKQDRLVKDGNNTYKLDSSLYVIRPNFIFYIYIFIIGILFLSGEHLTKYFEFTRMYPWSQTKTYLSKLALGLILIFIPWFLSMGLKWIFLANAALANISYFQFREILNVGISIFSIYIMVMGTGALAGNFLGHIGLFGMGLSGIGLWTSNLLGILTLIQGDLASNHWYYSLDKYIYDLPHIVKNIIIPMEGFTRYDYGNNGFYGTLILGLIYLGLGLYWTKKVKPERSQMMVMKNPENLYVKFFAILSTANIIQAMAQSIGAGLSIRLVIFVLALTISIKFYHLIFKSRIGFQS